MKRLLLPLLLLLVIGMFAYQCSATSLPVAPLHIVGPAGVKAALNVELAETRAQQERGLMHRRTLKEDAGMLFTYDPPQLAGFWMKNTFIPLDMVFIGPDWRVSRIEPMAQPHSEDIIDSQEPVAAVLEIKGGSAEKWGVQPGDRIVLP